MNSLTPRDLFLSAAEGLLERVVRLDESRALFPGGRNGPYFDLESPVRNSAHALASMAIAYRLTGEARFADCGRRLTAFLLTCEEFTKGGLHVHRQKPGKDWSNGVIGPAWVIEALALAGRFLDDQAACSRAQVLADSQPFDTKAALWRRRDPGGGASSVDRTLNHQVAFAVALQTTKDDPDGRVDLFLDHLAGGGIRVDEEGLLIHHVPRRDEIERWHLGRREQLLRSAANSPRLARLRGRPATAQHASRERDLGYHLYTLFCLARLSLLRPEHPIWNSRAVREASALPRQDGWLESLDNNQYAYPYNAPGLEIWLIAHAFSDADSSLWSVADTAMQQQFGAFPSAQAALLASSNDSLTLLARSFELGIAVVHAAGTRNFAPHQSESDS